MEELSAKNGGLGDIITDGVQVMGEKEIARDGVGQERHSGWNWRNNT